MDIIEIVHCSICGKETHLCKCGFGPQPDVVYHGPVLDAKGGALEMKLITPKQSDQSSLEEDLAEAQRLMGGI